jgi:hypothetical protein
MGLGKRAIQFFRRRESPRSGLDVLRENSQQPDLFDIESAKCLVKRAEADLATFETYAHAQVLRAWQALALFYRLDPGVLSINRRSRIDYLRKVAHHPEIRWAALIQFLWDLNLLRRDVLARGRGGLRVDQDPIFDLVRLDWFNQWASALRLSPAVARAAAPVKKSIAVTESTELLTKLLQVNETMYRSVHDGGTFDPQRPGKLGAVRRALREAGLPSRRLVDAGATFLARPGQWAGAPKKEKK